MFRTIAWIAVWGLFLATCGIAIDDVNFSEVYLDSEDYAGEVSEVFVSEYIAIPTESMIELTTEHFLEDLDYMQYVLENNFALFDVAYWAHGMCINSMFEGARDEMLNADEMDLATFNSILIRNFTGLLGIGHFNISSPREFNLSQRDAILQWMDATESQLLNFRALRRRVSSHHMNRYLDEQLDALQRGDYEQVIQLDALLFERGREDIEITQVLEEGQIAYLAIPHFAMTSRVSRTYQEEIFSFYEDIRDYEHLIVDLRGNPGGVTDLFYQLIVRPNIDRPFRADGYAFLRNGVYLQPYLIQPFFGFRGSRILSIDTALIPVYEMLESFDLPHLNMNDMERMDYGFRIHTNIIPDALSRFDYEPAFSGKIWVLTDHRMSSASQIAAWFAKESGFATLVGDTTGGVFGGPRIEVALPNTDFTITFDIYYVTDSYGRPLEAGTIPHHFNRPNMDALETVLILIAEGAY